MRRLAAGLLCVVACAPKPRIKVDTAELGASFQRAQLHAKTKCDALTAEPIPMSEQIALGRTLITQVAVGEIGPLGKDDELIAYLAIVGRLLAGGSSQLRWTFGYGDSEALGAFSTAGGFVFVSRGLLANASNEAQLAALLAQQIAIVTSGRPLEAYLNARRSACAPMAMMDELEGDGQAVSMPASARPAWGPPEPFANQISTSDRAADP